MVRVAGALLLGRCATACLRVCGWCPLAMAPLAPQRLVGRRGRRAATSVRVVHIVFHVFVQLLEEESAFKAHLLDPAMKALDAQARAIVAILNIGDAPSEIDTLFVVCLLYRRRKVRLGQRPLSWRT